MIVYYAIIVLAMIGGGVFYGPIIIDWAKDLWNKCFKDGE